MADEVKKPKKAKPGHRISITYAEAGDAFTASQHVSVAMPDEVDGAVHDVNLSVPLELSETVKDLLKKCLAENKTVLEEIAVKRAAAHVGTIEHHKRKALGLKATEIKGLKRIEINGEVAALGSLAQD